MKCIELLWRWTFLVFICSKLKIVIMFCFCMPFSLYKARFFLSRVATIYYAWYLKIGKFTIMVISGALTLNVWNTTHRVNISNGAGKFSFYLHSYCRWLHWRQQCKFSWNIGTVGVSHPKNCEFNLKIGLQFCGTDCVPWNMCYEGLLNLCE